MNETVNLMGMDIASLSSEELLNVLVGKMADRSGVWVVTANLDILRLFVTDESARDAYRSADLTVADGMPLVWASKLMGESLPERVAGSTFSETLIRACADDQLSVFLLGGAPGSAEAACHKMRERCPDLRIAGDSSLRFSASPTEGEIDQALSAMGNEPPRLILVGLGSPKQERVIAELRQRLPDCCYIGVGGTFSFLADRVERAPKILQQVGLEWLHRLSQEPKRLAHRYLVQDLPFFFRLLVAAGKYRAQRG